MSNTLRRYTSFEGLGLTEATATVASIVTAMGDNSMFAVACATDGKTAGWLPESYGFLRIHKVNNYYAMAEYQVVWPNAELWRGYYNAGDDGLKWSGWQPIATATPPQEFGLPLAEGYTGTNKYFKTQENLVGLYVNLHKSDSSEIANAVTFGTLPAGFRPSYNVYAPAVACSTVGTVTDVCEVAILPNGSVQAHFNNSGPEYRIRAYVLFVAAS